ncbi:MAG: hypothetical protein QUS14_07600, partial [Pyrinomonadaceae bacterium]|nr:hypothetical protein [Pyrinomonadaceae bacterium]
MRNIFVGISTTIATLLFGALNIHACSCGERQTPAKAYADASVVWIGTATKISRGGGRSGFGDLKVTLDVREFLKGRKTRPAEVFTSSQGTACGYPFENGETYLIYGYRDRETGSISTERCTRTREVDLGTVDDELEILRSLSVGRFEPRLYGAVEEITRGIYIGDRSPNRPMPGIAVIARGHSATYKAKTDWDGRFRFVDIRPGEYVLDLSLIH